MFRSVARLHSRQRALLCRWLDGAGGLPRPACDAAERRAFDRGRATLLREIARLTRKQTSEGMSRREG
jgi:hypothetical protein